MAEAYRRVQKTEEPLPQNEIRVRRGVGIGRHWGDYSQPGGLGGKFQLVKQLCLQYRLRGGILPLGGRLSTQYSHLDR